MQMILLPQAETFQSFPRQCLMRFTGSDNTKVLLYKIMYRGKEASKQMAMFMRVLNPASYFLLPMLLFAAGARMKASSSPPMPCLVMPEALLQAKPALSFLLRVVFPALSV
jgi:hypothetical protein